MTALLRPPSRRQPPPRPRLRAAAPVAPARPRRAQPAVRGPQRVGFLASGLLFVAVLVGNVFVHASITQGQFELERLRDSAAEREAVYQRHRLQVAEAEAPERILERARRLGMIEPAKVTYLTPTAKTSSAEPASRSTVPDPPAEAAQSWGRVKPHLDGRR